MIWNAVFSLWILLALHVGWKSAMIYKFEACLIRMKSSCSIFSYYQIFYFFGLNLIKLKGRIHQFWSKFEEGGPYSPDPRNTDATWSIFYTKVHLYHRSKKKKKIFWCHPKNPSKKLKKWKKRSFSGLFLRGFWLS